MPLDGILVPRLGNGDKISFWNDVWLGDSALGCMFPRLLALDINKHCTVRDKWAPGGWIWSWRRVLRYDTELVEFQRLKDLIHNIRPSDHSDCWVFKPDPNGFFSVKGVRSLVEDKILITDRMSFSWNNWVPVKVNVLVWRMLLHRLPTKLNLGKRGISLASNLCELCSSEDESEDHLFVSCPYARKIWKGLSSWCGVQLNCFGSLSDLFKVQPSLQLKKVDIKTLQAIVMCGFWFIWKARNEKIFRQNALPAHGNLDIIQANAFLWITNRRNSASLQWVIWSCCPLRRSS